MFPRTIHHLSLIEEAASVEGSIGHFSHVLEFLSTMDEERIGGRKKNGDKEGDRKKNQGEDKGKEPAIEEEPEPPKLSSKDKGKGIMPSLEDDKGKGIMPSLEDDEDEDFPTYWNWADHEGILGPVLCQGKEAICWAITFARAIQALLNIGRQLAEQHTLSIQHLINNVTYYSDGIKQYKAAFSYVRNYGLCSERQCPYVGRRLVCPHPPNINRIQIDNVAEIADVDDVDLRRLVLTQPIIGILAGCYELSTYTSGLYKEPIVTKKKRGDIVSHAVLIVGFGIDDDGRTYWIIQNSYGTRWGQAGFGKIHRQTTRSRQSVFSKIYYPEKKDYPTKKDDPGKEKN